MESLYFSRKIDDECTLFLAPLTDRWLALCGAEVSTTGGHFLFERRGSGAREEIEILAHVPSEDGIYRLRDMLGLD